MEKSEGSKENEKKNCGKFLCLKNIEEKFAKMRENSYTHDDAFRLE